MGLGCPARRMTRSLVTWSLGGSAGRKRRGTFHRRTCDWAYDDANQHRRHCINAGWRVFFSNQTVAAPTRQSAVFPAKGACFVRACFVASLLCNDRQRDKTRATMTDEDIERRCRAPCADGCQACNAVYPDDFAQDDIMGCCGESFADTDILIAEPRAVGRRGILRAAAPALAAPFIASAARRRERRPYWQISVSARSSFSLCAPPRRRRPCVRLLQGRGAWT